MADWPIYMPCERCGRRTAHRVWIAPLNLALCEGCFLAHTQREKAMAGEKQDNGPYTMYGRRTEHEAEVRLGSYDNLADAKEDANEAVDASGWHQASVRDRNDQTVHVGRKEDDKDQNGGPDDMPPAA